MDKTTRDYLIILSAHFFFFLNFSELILLPKYLLLLGLEPLEIGMVMGSFSVAVMMALPVVGLVSETLSRKFLFMLGSALMALPTFLYPYIEALGPGLFSLRVLQGVGFACAFGVAGALVSDGISVSGRRQLLGILTVVGILTHALGPALGEYLIQASGYPALFWSAALFGLVSCGISLFIPSRVSGGLRGISDVRLAFWPFVSTALLGVIFGSVVIFLPPYLVMQGVNNSSPFFIAFVLGSILVWTVLHRRIRRLRDEAAWVVSSLFLVLLLAFVGSVDRPSMLCVLSLLFGVGYGYLYPTLNAAVIEANTSLKGVANSAFVWSFNVGMLLASVGFGSLCDLVGYEAAFRAVAVLGGVLLAAAGVVGHEKQRR